MRSRGGNLETAHSMAWLDGCTHRQICGGCACPGLLAADLATGASPRRLPLLSLLPDLWAATTCGGWRHHAAPMAARKQAARRRAERAHLQRRAACASARAAASGPCAAITVRVSPRFLVCAPGCPCCQSGLCNCHFIVCLTVSAGDQPLEWKGGHPQHEWWRHLLCRGQGE